MKSCLWLLYKCNLFVSNWLQNLDKSKSLSLNLVIINFESFTFTGFSVSCLPYLLSVFGSNVCWTSIFMVWSYSPSIEFSFGFLSSFSVSFSSFFLLWNCSISTSFSFTSICFILSSFSKRSSWTLHFKLYSSLNVLQMFQDEFPVPLSYFSGASYDTYFWLFLTFATLYWFSSLLHQNPPNFVLLFVILIALLIGFSL